MKWIVAVLLSPLVLLSVLACGAADAAEVQVTGVSVGGVQAALLTPPRPRGGIILLAGGSGVIGVGSDGSIAHGGNQLVRTRQAYAARGFAVLVPEGGVNVAAAVEMMSRFGPTTLVGTSRGTQRAARGIAAGARPTRLVLTSGFLSDASGDPDNVMRILGSPAALPPTLVIAHRQDGCRKTLPAGVEPFLAWAHGKAKAVWLDGGSTEGDPCEARAHHGFNGIDGQVVSAVAGFAAR
ncbi:alpha/beta hydrolase [Azorhizobium doebereinerae]|uniref:alpha/beta hydrolase n=1 Tax=Azorhizobium doebereinerae TaxID=281091 RepID=UPI000420DC62|nr:alpha/beta hydrolase [Azorhizobium doebereinerae]